MPEARPAPAEKSRRPGRAFASGVPAVFVRTMSSEDLERLRAMFSRLSPGAIYERLHLPLRVVPERTIRRIATPDGRGEGSLVAVVGEEIVGEAEYVMFEGGRKADVALVVEDRWQHRGVGRRLLHRLAVEARSREVKAFVGYVLDENRRARGLSVATFSEVRFEMAGRGVHRFCAPLATLRPPAGRTACEKA